MSGSGTTFVVSPDSEFFKYFETGPGGVATPGATTGRTTGAAAGAQR
jgi:hypothetical protein